MKCSPSGSWGGGPPASSATSSVKGYLLKRKKSYHGLLQNCEDAVQLEEYRDTVVRMLASTRSPVRSSDGPVPRIHKKEGFPCLCDGALQSPIQFQVVSLEQFQRAKDRYNVYALQGPSQAAKTAFVKFWFKSPFCLDYPGGCLELAELPVRSLQCPHLGQPGRVGLRVEI